MVIVRKNKKTEGVMIPKKMALGDRQNLIEEKKMLEEQKTDLSFDSSQEKENLEKRLNKIDQVLEQDEESIAKGRKREALQSQQKQLAERIKVLVPSLHIQRAKPNTPEYSKALQWGRDACKPEVVQICEQYQNISRMLEPENPDAGSIEALVANS